MGGSVTKVIKNVTGAVGDVVEGVGDVVQDVVDPVSEALADFEDGVRDVVTPVFDGFNDVIENPYVQMIATIVDPTPGKIASTTLRTYAKANSGQDIGASDLAQLGISSVAALGSVPVPPETAQLVKSAAAIADGADFQDVLIQNFGDEAFSEIASGLEDSAKTALASTYGQGAVDILNDNMDYVRAGFDIARGEDPSAVIANRFGDQIVGALGSDDPTVNAYGYGALKTAVALDQGSDPDEALFAGAKEWRKRGGEFGDIDVDIDVQYPSLREIGTVAGVNLDEFVPDLAFIEDYAREFGDIEKPDLAFIEDFVRENAPNVDVKGFDFEGYKASDLGLNSVADIFNTDLNLKGVDLSGVDVPDIDIDLPDFDLPSFNLEQVAGLDDSDIMVKGREDSDESPTPTAGTDIAQMLLGTDSLKNPFLRG